ncbi:5'-_3' exoribonuclease [Entamoeba marina]
MGIPSFFKWLNKTIPNFTKRVLEQRDIDLTCRNPNGTEFDNLYIDANGLIHASLVQPTPVMIISHMYALLDRIVAAIRPRSTLFIAIDGVCPVAKMVQQRRRRFTGTTRSNSITPGTELMEQLDAALEAYVLSKMNDSSPEIHTYWRRINVVISGVHVPGEGEHKIYKFIKSQQKFNTTQTHIIYSDDADLFPRSLLFPEHNILILRSGPTYQQQRKPHFQLCSINSLSNYLLSLAHNSSSVEINADFVVLLSLIGNDFLPSIPLIGVASLDYLVSTYFQLHNTGLRFVHSNVIDFIAIKKYLSFLSENYSTLISFINHSNPKLPTSTTQIAYMDTNKKVKLGASGWIKRYDDTYFNGSQNKIHESSKVYLTGILWVFHYYSLQPISLFWSYRPHYAPQIYSLIDACEEQISSTFDPIQTIPLDPFVHLSLVIPPSSSSLLPKPLRDVFNIPEVKNVTPKRVVVDIKGNSSSYHGATLVNLPSINSVKEFITENLQFLGPLESIRNRLRSPLIFVANGKFGTASDEQTIKEVNGFNGVLNELRFKYGTTYFVVQTNKMVETKNLMAQAFYFVED